MKQVKFNLYVDEQKIRTLEQLSEHFNIDDLLEWYEAGVLQKWLKTRQYTTQLQQVEALVAGDQFETAKALIRIFDFTEEQAREALDSLKYRLNYAKNDPQLSAKQTDGITAYHARYEEIKSLLKERVV